MNLLFTIAYWLIVWFVINEFSVDKMHPFGIDTFLWGVLLGQGIQGFYQLIVDIQNTLVKNEVNR